MRLVSICASVALAGAFASPASAQQFVRDTGALVSPQRWTNGVAVGDFDGDGDEDIAFANGSTYGPGGQLPQSLYLNDGAGNFTDASAQLNVGVFNAQMVIADDVDNDGDLDLVYAPSGPYPATTQRPRVLINDGTANFMDESAARMPSTTMSSWCVAAADVDNDGDRDLIFSDGCLGIQGVPSQAFLFENNGGGTFTDVTATAAPTDLFACHDLIPFDYDGDLDIDIAFSGIGVPGKRGSLWINQGDGTFTLNNTLNDLCSTQTYEADWSDLDGDGDWDAAVQGISGFDEGWAENRGPDVAPTETVFSGANGDDDNELASMDYDMDGDMDVFVGSLGASREKVYRQDAAGVFTRVNIFQAITDSTLDFAFGDFDGDGAVDVVTAQGESGVQVNKIYDNVGPADTLAPRVLNAEVPDVVTPGMVFRIFVQDDWVDDGLTSASVSFTAETFVEGSVENTGDGDASFMGGAMFRALVPTTAISDGVRIVWTVTDFAGNTTERSVSIGDVGNDVWSDLGSGLAGSGGAAPVLEGKGPLAPSSNNAFVLTNALPSSTTSLVAGFTQLAAPFKGGVLVPSPDIVVAGLPLDGAGALTLPFVWPLGAPSGVDLFVQFWVTDAGGPSGFAASNGLRGTSQL